MFLKCILFCRRKSFRCQKGEDIHTDASGPQDDNHTYSNINEDNMLEMRNTVYMNTANSTQYYNVAAFSSQPVTGVDVASITPGVDMTHTYVNTQIYEPLVEHTAWDATREPTVYTDIIP